MNQGREKTDSERRVEPTTSIEPRAAVVLTGLLRLGSCTLREDGVAEWKLDRGIVVTLDPERNHWHVAHEAPSPPEPRGRSAS